MSQARPDVLSTSVQKTDIWLKELKEDMRLATPDQAYGALRAVLHALRDRLTVDTAAHLAAQLPTLLRGIYYDGYKPAATPSRIRHRDEFLRDVRDRARGHDEFQAQRALDCVIRLLDRHLEPGLIRKMVDQMPAELRDLWPERYVPRRPMDQEDWRMGRAGSSMARGMRGWGRMPARWSEQLNRMARGYKPESSTDWIVLGTIGAVALTGLAMAVSRNSRRRSQYGYGYRR